MLHHHHLSPSTYVTPYTATSPIPGITIDQATGQLSFNGSIPGNYVVVILIEEFDCNGSLIGSMMHDFQVIFQPCTNTNPTLSGIQNFNNFGTNASNNGNTISAGHGDQFCFDITSSSPTPSSVLDISSNILSVLPNATISTTTGNPNVTTVCWTYVPQHFGNHLAIQVSDNHCPSPGTSSNTFLLDLPPAVGIMIDTVALCDTSQSSLISNSNFGPPSWYDMNGVLLDVGVDITCNPCFYPNFLFTSDTVAYASVTNCGQTDTASFFISASGLPLYAFPDTAWTCENDSLLFINPAPNFVSVWQNSAMQDSIYLTFTNSQYVHFQLSNSGTCIINDSVYVQLSNPNAIITDIGWALEANPSVAYQWLFNGVDIMGATSQTYVPNNNGDYQVVVVDSLGCVDTSGVFTITTASLGELDHDIMIYRSEQQIIIQQAPSNATFELYDMSGKLIENRRLNAESVIIELPEVKQIYVVKLLNSNSQVLITKKL